MVRVSLRPVREADLSVLEENEAREADPWNWFTHRPAEALRRRFAADGMLSEEAGTLAERIEAETDVENIAEQRALERAGFTREGVLRHTQFRAGRWRDNIIYSVLRAEVSLDQF